ncbi:MAG: protein kinase [Acidobacteriota bacterium]
MTPERWLEIRELFRVAVELPPGRREQYLAEHCKGHPALQHEVDSLVAALQEDPDFLHQPAVEQLSSGSAEGAAAHPEFTAGELVAERYKIVRFVARGGMGEVYEAEDTELRTRVAMKTIHSAVADPVHAIARLRREVNLARKIAHPNVCRVFDAGRHRTRTTDGRTKDTVFLTMELLEGETLAQRMARDGPLRFDLAVRILAQVAEALHAAHTLGIVHRDLKSSNVMLVGPPGGDDVRASVTDFGMARGISPLFEHTETITASGQIVGTPAYMSPEQVEGKEVSPASDIYSLGVVMYEMATGRRPFVGDTPLSTALKRLTQAPPSPRVHTPDLDGRWETAMLRCMQRDPRERFTTPLEVVRLMRGESVPVSRKVRIRRWTAAAAVLLAAILGSVSLWLMTASPRTPRPSVAVLGFRNLSGQQDTRWLSKAFSEMLNTELGAGEKVRLVPDEVVERSKTELGLRGADSLTEDALARLRANLNADFVVVGSYVALARGGSTQIRLDTRLQDTRSGETIALHSETGTEDDLFGIVARSGRELRVNLGVPDPSSSEIGSIHAALPANIEAARMYADGLELLERFDALAAREKLEKAVSLDPRFALGHAALSEAWKTLGYDARAAREAKNAFELSGGLPREDRLLVEARHREAAGEWDQAIKISAALFTFFPDSIEYGLQLADLQTTSGAAGEAMATLRETRALPAPARDDPRIDLAEARAAASVADYHRQLALATRAGETGQARGAKLLVASARLAEADAMWRLGSRTQARSAAEAARALYDGVGDTVGSARCSLMIGNIIADQGDTAGAWRAYQDAAIMFRNIGNKAGEARALASIGDLCRSLGNVAEAKSLTRQALALFQELEDRRGVAGCLNTIATDIWSEGDLGAALRVYKESLGLARALNDGHSVSTMLNNEASILTEMGRLTEAADRLQEALDTSTAIGDQAVIVGTLINLGNVLWSKGEPAKARTMLEQAIAICRNTGHKTFLVRALSNSAGLLLDMAMTDDAAGSAEQALKTATEIGDKYWQSVGLGHSGDILMCKGDLAGAELRHQEALRLRTEIGEKYKAEESRLALAEIALEQGRPKEAELAARSAVAEFASRKVFESEVAAAGLLTRALVAQRMVTAARAVMRGVQDRAMSSENLFARLILSPTMARLYAAEGNTAEALARLAIAIKEAKAAGFARIELEARLAQAEIEVSSGHSEGQAHLEALARDASARQFNLIASKAAARRGE